MSKNTDPNINNIGTVRGILSRATRYDARSGAMQRLDVLVPSASPLEHPITVSIHSDRSHQGQLNQEVEIKYCVRTFLKPGKGKGSEVIFDQTRLYEL